ncbi:MAG: Eco57I restriction-modification methylase domain-containing protein [Pedobacter terrae]
MFGVKGFDIVIGNPPYVDIKKLAKDKVKYYFKNYQTAENRINLYSIFIEKGKSLLNISGSLVYINPNSMLINESYFKTRSFIIEDVRKIIKLPDSTFEAATVETIILILSKTFIDPMILGKFFGRNEKLHFGNIKFSSFNKEDWLKDPHLRFNIFSENGANNLLSKIEEGSAKLSSLVDFSLGITPYDSYKGHSKELMNKKGFHSLEKLSEEYVPLIAGKNIHRFVVSDVTKEYLRYGPWLGAPRDRKYFDNPKIIVRQILGNKNLNIIAAYSDVPNFFTQIGFSLISKTDDNDMLKYIVALLNSKLIAFYHTEKFLDKEKSVFQKILIANCKILPIKVSSNPEEIIECVNLIIKYKKMNFAKDIEEIMQKINLLVYKIYNLSEDEICKIEGAKPIIQN